jgi:hypothetical protein
MRTFRSGYSADGSLCPISKPDLINKRLLLSKALCVFACFHAPFVFVLDLIQAFDVLVKELGLSRYALHAAIKAPQ